MGVDNPKRRKFEIQDRNSNCGPVAIYNLLVWLGFKPHIYRIEALCFCDITYGTPKTKISNTLASTKLKFYEKKKAKLRDVEKALDDGYGVIYLYSYSKTLGHYIFINRQTKLYFNVVNDLFPGCGNVPSRLRRKSYFAIRRSKNRSYPHMWAIKNPKRRKKKRCVKKSK